MKAHALMMLMIVVIQLMMWFDSQEEAQQQRWSVSRGGLHRSGDVRHVVGVFLLCCACRSCRVLACRPNAQTSLDSSSPLVGVRVGDGHT